MDGLYQTADSPCVSSTARPHLKLPSATCLRVQLLSVPYRSLGLSCPGPPLLPPPPNPCFLPFSSLHISNSYAGQGQGLIPEIPRAPHISRIKALVTPLFSPFASSSLVCKRLLSRDLDFRMCPSRCRKWLVKIAEWRKGH